MHSSTLVLQSHREPLPYSWLKSCLQSVQHWANQNQFDYIFLGDELFDPVEKCILDKTHQQKVIATDLARLLALQQYLRQGYQTVIWCDADFLIFDPKNFILPESSYAVGREVWIQTDNQVNLKVYKKVHNAFLMFRQENCFLDFYIDSARRLIELNKGSMPAQFIGPKLLTALHNIVIHPVLETAAMFSPPVLQDINQGGGAALNLFKKASLLQPAAANLCSSLVDEHENNKMEAIIDLLIKNKSI